MRTIEIIWSTEDVIKSGKEMGITLNEDEAYEILVKIKREHDATIGITWDTIYSTIEDFISK